MPKPKRIDLLNPPQPRARLALFHKGFRPLFLLAALAAVVVVPLWLAVLFGYATPSTYLSAPMWHAHEMLFGFTMAVVAGFLLTAASNWTRQPTAEGWPLALLCALWVLGRVAMWGGAWVAPWLPALVDLAFVPAVAVAVGRPILATRTRRNYGFIVILGLITLANLGVHLDALDALAALDGWAGRGHTATLDLIVLIILVITGRIVPVFTVNTTEAAVLRPTPWLDRAAIGAMALVVALDVAAPGHWAGAALAALAGLAAGARALKWHAGKTLEHPLLWVLHAGHAWLVVGLLLRGVHAVAPLFALPLATHAITIGSIGALTLGMMVRVSLGHTGRGLAIGRWETAAFALINVAAAARVFVPMVSMDAYRTSLVVAGLAWVAAYAIYLGRFARILASPGA